MKPIPTSEQQALEARLSATIAARLTWAAEELPHDIVERLRTARESATQRARSRVAQRARAAVAAGGGVVVGRAPSGAALGGFGGWWRRAGALVPLAMLLVGLAAIDYRVDRDQVLVAAEIDAQLLADNLPPQAYTDPGFGEFLRTTPP